MRFLREAHFLCGDIHGAVLAGADTVLFFEASVKGRIILKAAGAANFLQSHAFFDQLLGSNKPSLRYIPVKADAEAVLKQMANSALANVKSTADLMQG